MKFGTMRLLACFLASMPFMQFVAVAQNRYARAEARQSVNRGGYSGANRVDYRNQSVNRNVNVNQNVNVNRNVEVTAATMGVAATTEVAGTTVEVAAITLWLLPPSRPLLPWAPRRLSARWCIPSRLPAFLLQLQM